MEHQHEKRRILLKAFDATVTPMTASELLSQFDPLLNGVTPIFLAGHNLHSLYMLQVHPRFREFYERCALTVIDGAPVLRLANYYLRRAHARKRLRSEHRIGSVDWIASLGEASKVQVIAIVGASRGSNTEAVRRLQKALPNSRVWGFAGEGWTPEQGEAALRALSDDPPDLALVGLGMPLQEQFLLDNESLLPPGIYATVGGAIDQISGAQAMAPRWLGALHIEWLWRLMHAPRRLGRRYLLEPFELMYLVAKKSRFIE
jgi:N-acetylglucosaminyldiphosphoundecaprenol N-acetyl-beta-D-mannosaminyltransferase